MPTNDDLRQSIILAIQAKDDEARRDLEAFTATMTALIQDLATRQAGIVEAVAALRAEIASIAAHGKPPGHKLLAASFAAEDAQYGLGHIENDLPLRASRAAEDEQDRRDVEEAERRLSDPGQVPEPFDPEAFQEGS